MDQIALIRDMLKERINPLYKDKKIDSTIKNPIKFYAVFGQKISYTLSPVMHNSVFASQGMPFNYEIVDAPVEDCVKWLKEKGSGANATIPHKLTIIPFLDEIDSDAKAIGAVNTILKREDGKLIGYNTDHIAIKELLAPYPGRVVIFGSGGAARAVVYATRGRDVTIISRTPEEAREKYSKFNVKIDGYENAPSIVKNSRVIINASPSVPEIEEYVTNSHVIFDMRYNPLDVGLNGVALRKGAKIIHGLEMLAIQAAEAQKIWFGKRPDSDLMLAVALNELTKKN
jgi:shikimate dehydrogenase